jgi:hypothetical protein
MSSGEAGSLRQAAIDCALRSAARWPDDLIEEGRRIGWTLTPDYARLGPATLAALDAEHDRRIFGTDTAAAWVEVADAVWDLPPAALRVRVEWALEPSPPDDPFDLWNAIACVVLAARVVDDAPLRQLLADLEDDVLGSP